MLLTFLPHGNFFNTERKKRKSRKYLTKKLLSFQKLFTLRTGQIYDLACSSEFTLDFTLLGFSLSANFFGGTLSDCFGHQLLWLGILRRFLPQCLPIENQNSSKALNDHSVIRVRRNRTLSTTDVFRYIYEYTASVYESSSRRAIARLCVILFVSKDCQ